MSICHYFKEKEYILCFNHFLIFINLINLINFINLINLINFISFIDLTILKDVLYLNLL